MHHDPDTPQHTPDLATQRRAMLAGVAGLAAGAFLTSRAGAGDLNPPPGPISPTMKPLDQIEPRIAINAQNTPGILNSMFRITARGSYYLTGSIVADAGKHGLLIQSDDVTVDLMGYAIISPVASSFNGIRIDGTRRNVVIRNGIVRGFAIGINWAFAASSNGLVEGIAASSNTNSGINAPENSVVRGCVLIANGSTGIITSSNASVIDCSVAETNGTGINANAGSTIANCTVVDGAGTGIFVNAGGVVTNSTARNNSGRGIAISANCMVSGCVSSLNGQQGIHATNPRCLIRDNQVSENRLRGIEAISDSTISHNNIINNRNASNQGAGIRVTGAGNRIDGNNIVLQAPGIQATGGGNIILRNTLRAANPNFTLGPGNTLGPTVTSANIATSSNPHANYSY